MFFWPGIKRITLYVWRPKLVRENQYSKHDFSNPKGKENLKPYQYSTFISTSTVDTYVES